MDNWPFPPPGGPIPWTAEQERDYQRQRQREQRNQDEEERNAMEKAPW